MNQKINWLFGSRKRGSVWFLILFGMVSLMLAPISKMDSKGSNPDSEVADLPFSEFEPNLNPSLARQQRGQFAPDAGVTLECISKAAQPLADTAIGESYIEQQRTISADGRYTVFTSFGMNLVNGQTNTNQEADVFVSDRLTGAIQLVSRAAGTTTTTGNEDSRTPVISADGRWVVFESYATNLAPGQSDTNFTRDIFVFDQVTGATQLVSRAAGTTTTTGDDEATDAIISDDGKWIAFLSGATNLVAGQITQPGSLNLFLYNCVTGTTELVSRAAGTTTTTGNSTSHSPKMSADGRWIVFGSSATNLIAGQVNGDFNNNVFVFDRLTGAIQLVSRVAGTTTATGNESSFSPVISADGQWIAFQSRASNLVENQIDTSGSDDVFLFDRVSGAMQLVSRIPGTSTSVGNNDSVYPMINADGKWIVFQSLATNLVTGQSDTNGSEDLFVYDRTEGTMQLVSRAAGTTTTTGNSHNALPSISADGKFIAYTSKSSNLIPGQTDVNGDYDVFVFDRMSGTNELVSYRAGTGTTTGNAASHRTEISADGQWLAFVSNATNLISGITDYPNQDLFLFNQNQHTNQVVSLHAPNVPSLTGFGVSTIKRYIYEQNISADNRYLVFSSTVSNLVPGQVDTNSRIDVFVYDRVTGATELVSRVPGTTATAANGHSFYPVISADGRFIAFQSYASNLVVGQIDGNGNGDVFLFDRVTHTTRLVSRVAGTTATTGSLASGGPTISADGKLVYFGSHATNLIAGLIDQNGPAAEDVYVYDRETETLRLVSNAAGTTATTGNGFSTHPSISANGQWVVFTSSATNLVNGQVSTGAPHTNIFVDNSMTGTRQLVSHAVGTTTTQADNSSFVPKISADGQWIAFSSQATNLIPGQVDTNQTSDVFLFDQGTGTTYLLSRAVGGSVTTGNGYSSAPVISANGRQIAYISWATNLVNGQVDTNQDTDVFVFDRLFGTNQLVSRAAGTTATTAEFDSTNPVLSANGQWVAYKSLSRNLVPGQISPPALLYRNIFAFNLSSGETRLISGENGSPTNAGNQESDSPQISNDGQFIGFFSKASNLIPGDYNNDDDVFVSRLSQPITATISGSGTGCAGQPTTLTATIAGGIPPYTLTLTNGGGTQTGTSPLTFTVSPSSTTTYAIQSGTDASGNPITGSGSATVTVTSCLEQSSVLVADTTNNRIQKFNGTTWSVVGPGTVGSGNGQFRVPEAVAFNSSGRIYVADTGNNRIQWSTNGGTTWATFAASGIGLNQVSGPRGLALDSIGNLYVADGGNGRIVRFNNGVPGNAVILATKGTTAGRVQTPNGLAIDIAFNLFIADTGNNRIQKITNAHTKTTPNSGSLVAGIGSGLTSVRAPQGVAVDSSGNLYVADTGNNRITRFTGGNPGTATLLAGAGTALGQVRAPEGVTLSAFSTGPLVSGISLIVSDTTNNRIQGRNVNGTTWVLVGTPNGLGTNPGQFRAPSKIR